MNGIGEGPLSNEACATPTTTPGEPTILQADLSGNNFENVTIRWILSSDDGTGQNSVVSYAILRNATYDANGTLYVSVGSVPKGTTEYTDNLSGEGDPDNYFYQVCAVDLNDLTNCTVNQAGKFRRSVLIGPNLVSIPLIQSDENIETVLQTVKFDKAWVYDSVAEKWKWFTTFKPYKGVLTGINETRGFWVNVTENCNFTTAGIVPIQTIIHLSKGWNLVGFPSFQQDYVFADLKADVTVERVEGFNVSAPPYFLRLMLGGDILETGYGYWMNVAAETAWTVRNE